MGHVAQTSRLLDWTAWAGYQVAEIFLRSFEFKLVQGFPQPPIKMRPGLSWLSIPLSIPRVWLRVRGPLHPQPHGP